MSIASVIAGIIPATGGNCSTPSTYGATIDHDATAGSFWKFSSARIVSGAAPLPAVHVSLSARP
jgi:hypothetical protein